ncbi:TetR/AcrR family transcriptional regulator [Kutzneria buriramensis]|uniref:AcrR family transcriptional regulator n=1 Tax=Kutzneria buriramensis TaxID=1045776 RepID=A0A3E0HEG8_9PSEU|nr:TetR/AcrR family transcriptional regulator [Kutzneria buriramensis]REH43669.1 AcrR family transcriptional regulator [Kutzneria buriramensis]
MALRSDAAQNRERILAVAREALTEDGDASLNSIAKRAGVGPGTLYRHFPNRESLVLEVFRTEVQGLAARTSELLRTEPPLDAFRQWSRRLAAYLKIKRGLGEALTGAVHDAMTTESHGPVIAGITALLDAGVADGSIRPGVDPDDLLLMMGALWRVPPGPAGERQADRLLELIVSALRP